MSKGGFKKEVPPQLSIIIFTLIIEEHFNDVIINELKTTMIINYDNIELAA